MDAPPPEESSDTSTEDFAEEDIDSDRNEESALDDGTLTQSPSLELSTALSWLESFELCSDAEEDAEETPILEEGEGASSLSGPLACPPPPPSEGMGGGSSTGPPMETR